MWRASSLSLVLVLGVAQAAGEAPDFAADPAFEARVNRVAAELRCLVCQNQSLADSHAPLAIQLKDQVREQLRAGRDEEQVVTYMTERYGDFVRYRPALKASTVLLWTGPALLVLGGFGLLAWTLRRRPPPASLNDDERARAAALLEP
jgi:cytochrome c-type biogenesis protein CcmH